MENNSNLSYILFKYQYIYYSLLQNNRIKFDFINIKLYFYPYFLIIIYFFALFYKAKLFHKHLKFLSSLFLILNSFYRIFQKLFQYFRKQFINKIIYKQIFLVKKELYSRFD
jgi:hypothetical protein